MSATPNLDRASIVDAQFLSAIQSSNYPSAHSDTTPQAAGLSKQNYLDLFHSQCTSRHLDLIARKLKDKGQGYYTIGSSGHEGNAAIALAHAVHDMAFLHYRSGAFVLQRAHMHGLADPIFDQLLSLVASSDDPISAGRHKVFGSLALNIPPQTSTIASHLPKATGAAFAIAVKKSLEWAHEHKMHKNDEVIVCSFGDGSANHSTALGAFNAAAWAALHQVPMPIVFVCEDNGLAISVPTPDHWIHNMFCDKTGMHYLACDGRNLADVYQKAKQAHDLAKKGQPVFLHMATVRLLGHAGSDIEFHYNSLQEVQARENDDPILHSAATLEQQGWMSSQEITAFYQDLRLDIEQKAQRALKRPRLSSTSAILSALVPPKSSKPVPKPGSETERQKVYAKQFASLEQPKNISQSINCALTDLMLQYSNLCVFGEDVGKKGGVYRVTQMLQQRFGRARVFDTLLDEQTILGTAIGFAQQGLLPIPEIQFLAYTHNASDQIRGEAATLSFFSNGQFTNPMVIRIPGLAYQKGFGGHFHNDNAFAFLREIPGIILACPSKPAQAAKLLRECVRLAHVEQRVVVFLEPIALYMTKDLLTPGDNLYCEQYPSVDKTQAFGEVLVEGNGTKAIISYGNGAYLSRAALATCQRQRDIKLIDLSWLHPLPEKALAKALEGVNDVLIVDECRKTGSLSEQILSWLFEHNPIEQVKRLTGADSFITIGQSWQYLLPSKQDIVDAISHW